MVPFGIVVAAEDESDARRVKSLIDRILVADIDWLAEQAEPERRHFLDGLREWRGHDPTSSFLDIHKVHDLADARGLPSPHGHFDGRPAAPDYHGAVRALWLLLDEKEPPVAFIWVRDTDGQTSRITGWADACEESGKDLSVLIGGFPHECMEAWLLVAFAPSEHQEQELRTLRQQLGFNPVDQPERLSHKENVPRSAKGVCRTIGLDEMTWDDADPNDLAQRGVGCGLAAFPAVRRGPKPQTAASA
jgi:hypothetical protein